MRQSTAVASPATHATGERAVYYVLFFFSGASALAYEALWLRTLALQFGATAAATSATLGAFIAGLGLGGYWGARVASRSASPLKLYALLEIGLALTALAVDPLFEASSWILTGIYRSSTALWLRDIVRVAISLAVLLPPTLLMGATLPALSQALVQSPHRASHALGMLYGVNTLGAALGVMATGFILIPELGTNGARYTAVGVNIAVGIGAFLAHRRGSGSSRIPNAAHTTQATHEPGATTRLAGEKDGARLRGGWLLLSAYALSGAVALACEVVWTRVLVFFTGSTTYAFTMMLAVLLIGLAIGSVVMGRIGDRIRQPAAAIALVLAGIALMMTVGFAFLPDVATAVTTWAVPGPSWGRNIVAVAVMAATTLFLPATGFGAVFPLVAREEIRRGHAAGAAAGRAYACNLAGAVTGAYLGGFVLIPAFGLSGTLRLLALLLCVTALLLIWADERTSHLLTSRTEASPARVSLVTRLVPVMALAAPLWLLTNRSLHQPSSGEAIVYYSEGPSATVSVLRDPTGAKTLYIDRISVAGTDPVMQTDQKSLAHLPMLLHPNPRSVLTVGFGSGGASWSYTRYSELERIDCVEIASEVVGAAPHLREANHDLFSDPRYRVIMDDARAYLRHTDTQYDVIATDCTDLRYKGNASLYTSEYFGLCRRRLRPDGLVIVWMPLGGLSSNVFRLALNTFAQSFPQVSMWYMNNYPTHYLLLVGSQGPHQIAWERLLEQLERPNVRQDLESVGLANPFKLLATHLLGDRAIREFVAGAPTNSDAWPRLEFFAPRSADLFSGARNLQTLLQVTAEQPTEPPFVTRYGEAQRRTVLQRLQPYREASALLNRGHVSFQAGRQEFDSALAYYRRAASANPNDRQIPALIAATTETRDQLLMAYRSAATQNPHDPGVLHNLGLTLLAAGHASEAMTTFQQLVSLRPELADAHLNLSRAARAARDVATAERSIQEAVRRAPDRFDAHFQRGLVAQDRGDLPGALDAFERAAALNPTLAEAHFNAGMVLMQQQRPHDARRAYEIGLQQDPRAAFARINYAQVLLMLGEHSRAAVELERVVAERGPASIAAQELLNSVRRQ
jgi:spermidine synthase